MENSIKNINHKRYNGFSRQLMFSLCAVTCTVSGSLQAQQQKDFSLSFSPDGKQIVYYSYRGDALPDLYIANADGTHERQLTRTESIWEIAPRWSPDGSEIVFSGGPSMQDLEIFSIKPDGSDLKQLTDGVGNGHTASWSPDGNIIIYSRFVDKDNVEIRYIVKDTGKEQLMTQPNTGRNTNPIWSPDGEKIAFASNRGADGDDNIYVTDPHFKEIKQITYDKTRQDFLTWAPDSRHVLYSASNKGGKHDIFSANIVDGTITNKTKSNDHHEYFTAFHPNGSWVYFDKGNWEVNFFTHKGKWPNQIVKAEQVGGKDWVDTIAIMEQEFLAPMIGKWKGISTHGSSKGRFEEVANYQWGPNKKSILVELELFWDGKKYGNATGLLGLDRKTKTVYYNLVMEDGTVVMQQQRNAGESTKWVMDVTSAGNSRSLPKQFRVEYSRNNDHWKSDILVPNGENWELMAVHEFTRLN
ncbi:TolB family protein [Thalassotalea ganghwensis]